MLVSSPRPKVGRQAAKYLINKKKHLSAGKAIAEQRLVLKARNKSKKQHYEHPRPWRRSDVFIDNFEHISHVFLVFLLLILKKLMFDGQ